MWYCLLCCKECFNFWVCEWNPKVRPFKWKLLGSTFLWGGSNVWTCGWNPKVLPFRWKLLSSFFTFKISQTRICKCWSVAFLTTFGSWRVKEKVTHSPVSVTVSIAVPVKIPEKKKDGQPLFPFCFSQERRKKNTLIDLFTDTAAILNLLDLRSIMGCSLQCRRFLWARNLLARAPCWNFPKRGGDGAS